MSYLETQFNATVHEGDIEVDPNIVAQFPSTAIIKACQGHARSYWSKTGRLDIEIDGKLESYFLKLADGDVASPMLNGEFESMKLIHKFIPKFSPRPIAYGKCQDSERYFSLYTFHELLKDEPEISRFTSAVAQLHTTSAKANLTGKFGFDVTTYNGTLPQDNAWTDSWEEFYARGMRHMLKIEMDKRGEREELEPLIVPFLDKVIPRLLRPLETKGRSIKPVLIHGDLWLGNVSQQKDSGDPLMYDSSAFWGHNEYELGIMRPLENEWATQCMESYHEHIPKSEPRDDWDARNALYSIRAIIHDSALWPKDKRFRVKLVDEIKKLVEKFPEGYVEGNSY
ncbi:Fructosamine kinase-domain-containing protein [Nemania sp. FL0031]|nr:Fructosamine kinase-domain-containing protein [Nemania sp. FL0031]